MVVKEGGGYRVKSESGKNLSKILPSLEVAQKRLREVEHFKRAEGSSDKK